MARKKRKHELSHRDYMSSQTAAYYLPDCADYLTGREYHSGISIDFQVR